MDERWENAEQELIELYTEKALAAYQGGKMAVPSGSNLQLLDTFYEMLCLLYGMAKKMPPEQKGTGLLLKSTRLAMDNFKKRNHRGEQL